MNGHGNSTITSVCSPSDLRAEPRWQQPSKPTDEQPTASSKDGSPAPQSETATSVESETKDIYENKKFEIKIPGHKMVSDDLKQQKGTQANIAKSLQQSAL